MISCLLDLEILFRAHSALSPLGALLWNTSRAQPGRNISPALLKENQDLVWSLPGRDDFDDSSHPLYTVDLEINDDRVMEIAAKVDNKTDPEIITLQSEMNFALDLLWILGSAFTILYLQS